MKRKKRTSALDGGAAFGLALNSLASIWCFFTGVFGVASSSI